MNKLLLRAYFLLCSLCFSVIAFARGERDEVMQKRGLDEESDFIEHSPLNISIEDVVLVAVLLVACYVFGRIWKGCTYLLLAVAALLYFLSC